VESVWDIVHAVEPPACCVALASRAEGDCHSLVQRRFDGPKVLSYAPVSGHLPWFWHISKAQLRDIGRTLVHPRARLTRTETWESIPTPPAPEPLAMAYNMDEPHQPQGGNNNLDSLQDYLANYQESKRTRFAYDSTTSGIGDGQASAGWDLFSDFEPSEQDVDAGPSHPSYAESSQNSIDPSGWDDSDGGARRHRAQSVFTHVSTAPSHGPQHTFVEIVAENDQAPLRNSEDSFEKLPCEFVVYHSCEDTFHIDDDKDWVKHIRGHLKERLPAECKCWYCPKTFNASDTTKGDRLANFKKRMKHIRKHFKKSERTPVHRMVEDMRPDFAFLKHLKKHKLITNAMFERAKTFREGGLLEFAPGNRAS